jgi:hypothetical protein
MSPGLLWRRKADRSKLALGQAAAGVREQRSPFGVAITLTWHPAAALVPERRIDAVPSVAAAHPVDSNVRCRAAVVEPAAADEQARIAGEGLANRPRLANCAARWTTRQPVDARAAGVPDLDPQLGRGRTRATAGRHKSGECDPAEPMPHVRIYVGGERKLAVAQPFGQAGSGDIPKRLAHGTLSSIRKCRLA